MCSSKTVDCDFSSTLNGCIFFHFNEGLVEFLRKQVDSSKFALINRSLEYELFRFNNSRLFLWFL